ncbi:hypothetical protein LCGC14_2927970 [marine sediment metagenome]|uniref:HTH luxR-type domain-containing protein n=1 Tax=marine sediment metagenome TaxID=412755 RepID=A0A0F8XLU4_9ZZZZ
MSEAYERLDELRLLIVHDHGLAREGMLALFRSTEQIRAKGVEAAEAAWVARHLAPDVVLIALALSGACAFETAESILQECRSSRMMFLDDTLRPHHLRMTLAAGAHGYWTKRASFDQLCEAIRRVASGGSSVCPAARRYLVGSDGKMRFDQAANGTPLARITRRERQVLVLLAEGLSVKQVAERLCLSPRTVDSHRSNLMKKLGIHKIVDLVRLALREGLIKD